METVLVHCNINYLYVCPLFFRHPRMFCHQMNVNEAQNFRATSIETLRHMVAAGIGMTLMPSLACDNNKIGLTH